MILVKKFKFFHILCLSKIDLEKVFPDVLHKKDTFKDHKNKLFIKNAKLEFFKRGKSVSLVKNLRFLQLRFLSKINQEKLSGNVLVRKTFL